MRERILLVCVWFLGCFAATPLCSCVRAEERERTENVEKSHQSCHIIHRVLSLRFITGRLSLFTRRHQTLPKYIILTVSDNPNGPALFIYIFQKASKRQLVIDERENRKSLLEFYMHLYYNHIKTTHTQKKTTKLFWQQYHTNMAISPFAFFVYPSAFYISKYTRIIIIHIFFSFQIAFSISNTTCYRMSGPGGLLLHMTIKPPPSAMSIIYPQEGGGGAPA